MFYVIKEWKNERHQKKNEKKTERMKYFKMTQIEAIFTFEIKYLSLNKPEYTLMKVSENFLFENWANKWLRMFKKRDAINWMLHLLIVLTYEQLI